ncbi:hypothetical protein KGP36_05985 [Patescibacteria group bacterium]|nr:hypothetical protein [Patescibacteria group bacterium]
MVREEVNAQPMEFPASVDAERSILGAILLDNSAHKECVVLNANDFALDSHQRIFAAMGKLIGSGHAVDIVTLAEEMNRRKEVAEIGGVAYLASLIEGLPRGLSIKEWCAIVKEKSLLRQIIGACSSATTKAADQVLTAAEIVEQLGKDLKGIRKK